MRFINYIYNYLRRVIEKLNAYFHYIVHNLIITALLELRVRHSGFARQTKRTHGLPGTLVVSLTSYPPRFSKLHLTLKCLLNQTLAVDHIVLWIAKGDQELLGPSILNLQTQGVEIAYCDDVHSYKKIIPTLQRYKGSFIVTADDDLFYWPTWLEELVEGYREGRSEIVCHRAHRISRGSDGLPLPYLQWEFESHSSVAEPDMFPTTGGGVLYSPGCFYSDVANDKIFLELSPNSDDIWLYWMIRLQGYTARIIGERRRFYYWLSTQKVALWRSNMLLGDNDTQVEAMVRRYGFPRDTLKNPDIQ